MRFRAPPNQSRHGSRGSRAGSTSAGLVRDLHESLCTRGGRRPELRPAYIQSPWPLLYESNVIVASVAVEQKVGDEQCVARALAAIEEKLNGPILCELESLRQADEAASAAERDESAVVIPLTGFDLSREASSFGAR